MSLTRAVSDGIGADGGGGGGGSRIPMGDSARLVRDSSSSRVGIRGSADIYHSIIIQAVASTFENDREKPIQMKSSVRFVAGSPKTNSRVRCGAVKPDTLVAQRKVNRGPSRINHVDGHVSGSDILPAFKSAGLDCKRVQRESSFFIFFEEARRFASETGSFRVRL